ncbi:MAG: hydrogenase maturation protein [Pseudomonadota bacterium]
MRILFITHSFNSLAQRLFVALREAGHRVSIEFDINDPTSIEAVDLFRPDLVVAPFLKRAIPGRIWRSTPCLIVHPGVIGDRGPSALDWAILNQESTWGVTVLQANEVMDGGAIWASETFTTRGASKSSLYRTEVTSAAVTAVTQAVARFEGQRFQPQPLETVTPSVSGRSRPLARQADRAIDWSNDETSAVLRKIRSADGFPGLRDAALGAATGKDLYLYDAHPAPTLAGTPGTLVARSGEAVGVATVDGGIWLGRLRDRQSDHNFKLPAVQVLGPRAAGLEDRSQDEADAYRDIRYVEREGVGFLHFPFYNGAMSTDRCERLLSAYREAVASGPRVIVLCGGSEFWSNGMDLNQIEAADSAADESWRNINAIDDISEAIIRTTDCLTVAALRGNAGAGGVFLARAADEVWSHDEVTLNPHYKDMGNLFGSEYWTYLLPRCCGEKQSSQIMAARLPVGIAEAQSLGLVDRSLTPCRTGFMSAVEHEAAAMTQAGDLDARLHAKRERREHDEAQKPLNEYRAEELARMRTNFYGFDPSYHIARYNFVHKIPRSRTPLTIAEHRRRNPDLPVRDVS